MFGWLTERRRKHLLETPFPEAWTAILETNVAAYALLLADEQQRLRDLTQIFIAEKNFEGCGGLELTDEIRVTIAGTGCQMLLGRDHELFRRVVSILVYPSTFVLPPRPLGVFYQQPRDAVRDTPVVGVAHSMGAVALAWDNALHGARDGRDGRNTVVHELAHEIDMLDGAADGMPPLDGPHATAWRTGFQRAFVEHRERAARGEPSLLRDYAITNVAEYFAVAAEVFFEQPLQLALALPDVYMSLREYFGVDLAARVT
jgi:MtfA peptidase